MARRIAVDYLKKYKAKETKKMQWKRIKSNKGGEKKIWQIER